MSTTKSKKTRRYVSKKRARMIALREQQIIQEVNRGDDQLERVTYSDSDAGCPNPTVPTVTECQSELRADTPRKLNMDDLDQSFTEHTSDDNYSHSPPKQAKRELMPLKSIGNKVFIAQSSAFGDFINQINMTSQCKTYNCKGKLMLAGVRTLGLGGAILLRFSCSGCENRPLVFQSCLVGADSPHSDRLCFSSSLCGCRLHA